MAWERLSHWCIVLGKVLNRTGWLMLEQAQKTSCSAVPSAVEQRVRVLLTVQCAAADLFSQIQL